MPNPSSSRSFVVRAGLLWWVAAALVFAACGMIADPAVLPLVLLADTLILAALAHIFSPPRSAGRVDTLGRRVAAGFLLLAGYAAGLMALVAYPALWLLREPTLPATLALSTAAVLALLSLWRWWPAFGLVWIWRGAFVPAAPTSGLAAPGSVGIAAALRRCLKLAVRLTAEQDTFFSHGLPVALALLLLGGGALSLCVPDSLLESPYRPFALLGYAVLVPLLGLVVLNRGTTALLLQARLERNLRGRVRAQAAVAADDARETLLAQLENPLELNAALLDAVRAGQIDLALATLARGADANLLPAAGDRDQRSVLVLAAVSSDLRLLRALIGRGADVNRVHNGLAPLLAATRDSHQGRIEAVTMLLTNGANARLVDVDENTPLHHAALSAEPVVAALLLDAGADINAANRAGYTPLATACAMANWGLVRFLLERGARLEVDQAQPVLAVAAGISEDDSEGVKLLLKRRARVDTTGPLGRSALMNAALHGHAAIARVLLDAGASVQLVDSHGVGALMEAARAGAENVIALLATRKPDPNALDAHGRSALMIACQSRQAGEGTIRQLLALGADVHTATPDGRRALDFALANGRWDLVALLDPEHSLPHSMLQTSAANTAGVPAAHLLDALRFGHWPVVELFDDAVRSWPASQLAGLYLELQQPIHAGARRWLLNHGLPANTHTDAGVSLAEALLTHLPASLAALGDLLDAGAQVSGAPGLVQVIAATAAQPLASGAAALDADSTHAALQELALRLLESGADFCVTDALGRGALATAIEFGMTRVVDALLARGVDPNARDVHGRAPMHAALTKPLAQALPLLQALLRAGADPEATAANNETPLGLALARAEPELCSWLRWGRWSLPGRALLGSDVAAAATLGDGEAVRRLLLLGFDVNARDTQGASALLRAAGSGHADLVEQLLGAGADASQAAPSGVTALAAAANARRLAVVELLLNHGVAADQALPNAITPLMLASAQAYPEIVERLLAHGAAVNARDDQGRTPLHAAAQFAFQSQDSERCQRTFDLLIGQGADLALCNNVGQNALLLLLGAAAAPGQRCNQKHLSSLLPTLLGNRAAIDLQDQRGVSALHACAMHGLLLPLRALLGARANTGLRDVLGRPAVALAQRFGYVDLAAELDNSAAAVPSAAQILRQRHDA